MSAAGDAHPADAAVAPTKAATDSFAGAASSVRGVGVLLQRPCRAEDRDAVAEADASSMSWVTKTTVLRSRLLDRRNSLLQPLAGDRVEGAERLVHEQHRRVGRERPGDADPLLLAAGELARVAVGEASPGSRPTSVEQLVDARLGVRGLVPAEQARARSPTFSATVRCGNSPICWMT